MANTVSRLTKDGTYFVPGELDEISQTNISVGPAGTFSSEFDEVTLRIVNAANSALAGIIAPTALENVAILTSGSSWTVPSDFNISNNEIHLIGGGGGGTSSLKTIVTKLLPGTNTKYIILESGTSFTVPADFSSINQIHLVGGGGGGAGVTNQYVQKYIGSSTAAAKTVIFSSAGLGTWTVPSDWNPFNNTIELIGAGGGGSSLLGQQVQAAYQQVPGGSATIVTEYNVSTVGGLAGGGAGAYTKITNANLTPGQKLSYRVGAKGTGGTSRSSTGNISPPGFPYIGYTTKIVTETKAPTAGQSSYLGSYEAGGGGAASGSTGGSGGSGTYDGGNGGNGFSGSWFDQGSSRAKAGGGGAGGPNGDGGNGGDMPKAYVYFTPDPRGNPWLPNWPLPRTQQSDAPQGTNGGRLSGTRGDGGDSGGGSYTVPTAGGNGYDGYIKITYSPAIYGMDYVNTIYTGGGGGGGGGYTRLTNLNLTPGAVISYSIGTAGNPQTTNVTSNTKLQTSAATAGGTTSFGAYGFAGGGAAAVYNIGGTGGTGTYRGGSGGNAVTGSALTYGDGRSPAGGGAAGGPSLNGNSGGFGSYFFSFKDQLYGLNPMENLVLNPPPNYDQTQPNDGVNGQGGVGNTIISGVNAGNGGTWSDGANYGGGGGGGYGNGKAGAKGVIAITYLAKEYVTDYNNSFISGGAGGGGGGYTKITNAQLTPNTTISYSIGTGGTGAVSVLSGNNVVVTSVAQSGTQTSFGTIATANGGSAAVASTAGTGGTGTYSGGSGGSAISGNITNYGDMRSHGGGGGAAGPNGSGGNGAGGAYAYWLQNEKLDLNPSPATGTPNAYVGGGGGGGNGGGGNSATNNTRDATGSAGGNNNLGAGGGSLGSSGTNGGGGGGGQNNSSTSVGLGSGGKDVTTTLGSGGGGGGGNSKSAAGGGTSGGSGGTFGGGGGGGHLTGGSGAQGLIVVKYTKTWMPQTQKRETRDGKVLVSNYFDEVTMHKE